MTNDTTKRPNFLVILVDDLGYSDIGCYGAEIPTPNLDRLAAEGIRFSDYHASSFCSPTRSMMMSGTDCHLAGLGVMSEFAGADRQRWQKPGHEGYLNHDVAALPEVLQDAGYHTMMSGKWHLGFLQGQIPKDRGFDRSWSLLPGCTNHFGWEPQWEGGEKGRENLAAHHPMTYADEDRRWIAEPNVTNSKDGFYSTQFYTDNLLKYLKDRKDGERAKDPFFAYLPFSAPHWPLQCFPEDRDKFVGMYDDGPAALRLRRIQALKDLGIVKKDTEPHPVVATTKEWEEMTPGEKKMSARAQECFSGMVHCIDREVGKVIDFLEQSGELDNTVVMFMSDNGSEGAAIESEAVMGPRMAAAIDKWYDNSYENLGNHNSWIWYGPRWAQAATAPHRLAKRFTTEGGIRVPLIVRYPPFKQYKPGSICHSFSTCMDLMPTFLQLAGITHPNANPATPTSKAPFRGHMVYPMRGKSWVPYMIQGKSASSKPSGNGEAGEEDAIWGVEDEAVGWEMHGCAALRYQNWKIVNMPVTEYGTGGWELFDLSKDLGETKDLAKVYPEKLKELLVMWDKYVDETGTVFGPPIDWGRNAREGKPEANWDPDFHPPPNNWVQGDIVEDQKAWMRLGRGQRLADLDK